ncbi:MAG: UTP--glucose-1-phosphate uridylyltransferase [Chloroflexota bacterium]|nr:UTP--glucose-1-phosphate uridylyltransferase [Chloroflexota bacterium]
MRISKAIIPVAGLGTRFLPVSISVPKAMIPVFDRPPIHFSVQEASESGIDHITLVASEGQESILKYFDKRPDLEEAVTNRKNPEMLELLREIPDMADISVVIQKEQLGLGHAILQARKTIGEQDFAILLPDDLILSNRPTIGEMCSIAEETNNMVLAVREVEEEAVPNLGIVNQGNDFGNTVEVLGMVEKPSLETAPSNMAIIGRYVLPAEIFEAIQNTPPGSLGEIQLTDGIIALLNTFDCTGYKFTGTHFDVGTPFGMLNASLHIAKTQFGFDLKK